MNSLERRVVEKAIAKAHAVGVDPSPVLHLLESAASPAAREWADAHPDEDLYCCIGAVSRGAQACTCWEPVFDAEQLPPLLECEREQQPTMCHDCAYRPDSPERSNEPEEEALLTLPADGEVFHCHQGIRRPTHYRHPDGHVVPANDSDYQPLQDPRSPGVPYRADGRPALICAGWAAHKRALEARA